MQPRINVIIDSHTWAQRMDGQGLVCTFCGTPKTEQTPSCASVIAEKWRK